MSIEFKCHVCGRLLRTTDEKAGRTAKCPGCGEAVGVPLPGEFEPSEPDFDERDQSDVDDDPAIDADTRVEADPTDEDDIQLPVPRPAAKEKVCPTCGETIKASAMLCRFCGERFGANSNAGGANSLDFGEIFSLSWKHYNSDMGLHITATLIYVLIDALALGLAVAVGFIVVAAVGSGGAAPAAVIAVLVIVALVGIILTSMVRAYMSSGYIVFLLKSVRGEVPEFSDLFTGKPYFLQMLANSLIAGLLIFAGFLLCYVPGIIVALIIWPYGFVLIDEKRPGLEPLYRAKELMEGNWGPVFLLLLVAGLINSGASSFCPVAVIFVFPWIQIMTAIIYCRLTGQTVVEH